MTGKYRIELILRFRLRQRWYWRLIDTSNNEMLAHSEMYRRRVDAMATATQLANALGTTPVVLGKL